jgi:hypothetical protein
VASIIDYYGDNQDKIIANAGPGHWNDPDMVSLETSTLKNLITTSEYSERIRSYGTFFPPKKWRKTAFLTQNTVC